MATCWDCGEEIVFRYIDGRPQRIHLSGNWCSGSGSGGTSSHYPSTVSCFEDACWSTTCPECGEPVYFVRHNGGSVWFDSLGWPWEKHSCFYNEESPSWFEFFKEKSSSSQGSSFTFGVIIKVERVVYADGSSIYVGVDCGEKGRYIFRTDGSTTVKYLQNNIVLVDWDSKCFFTSKHDEKKILSNREGTKSLGWSGKWNNTV